MERDLAWRIALLVPAGLFLVAAVLLKLLCQDTPTARRFIPSEVGKAKPAGICTYVSVLRDPRVSVMIFQYASCFGTELAMYNQLPRHFSTYFQMTSTNAALMSSIFGLTNIFSRPLGGVLSDVCFWKFGLRGRVWLHFLVLFMEAVFLFAFGCVSNEQPVAAAGILLFIFSVFCEMGCGTTYGVVPFINRQELSTVSALVGAGGNLGALLANVCLYKPISDDLMPYQIHAAFVMFWALLTPVYYWPEHGGMFWRPSPAAGAAADAKDLPTVDAKAEKLGAAEQPDIVPGLPAGQSV